MNNTIDYTTIVNLIGRSDQSVFSTFVNVACIPFIIALTAVAFPLLLQTISRIDDKYSSTNLVKVFSQNRIYKYFLYSLVFSISSILIWIFLSVFVDIEIIGSVIIICSTILLVVNLFSLVKCIIKFYSPSDLLEFLNDKHNKSTSEKERIVYFKSISDLLYFSIKHPNEKIARILYYSFVNMFSIQRERYKDEHLESGQIIYPQEYYDMMFEANEQFCMTRKKTISGYNGVYLNLLLNNGQGRLSEDTYYTIWLCLRQCLFYERDDIFMSYWMEAYQFFDTSIPIIYEKFNEADDITNHDLIEKREIERKRFLEFHYAIGGLLIYLGECELLRKTMNYTNSNFSRRVLIPESLNEVIIMFMNFNDPKFNSFIFESRYSFPDNLGFSAGQTIKESILNFLGLLLLRLFVYPITRVRRSSLDLPALPDTINDLKGWQCNLDRLKVIVKELLSKKELLNTVGIGHINNDSFTSSKGHKSVVLIDELIKNVVEKYENVKKEQSFSNIKNSEFKEKTTQIILDAISKYTEINNNTEIKDKYNQFFINGISQLMNKAGFADNQDITYLDSDTYVADKVASKIHFGFKGGFAYYLTKVYLLESEFIFKAIDKLDVDLKDYTIISFSVNLLQGLCNKKVDNLRKEGDSYYFHDTKIVTFDTYIDLVLGGSIVVIKNDDLPRFIYSPISQEQVEKYKLEELDSTTHLSTSILDLNKEKDLREQLFQNSDEKLNEKVLVNVCLSIEIRWKSSTKCYQFKPFNPFSNKGVVQNLDVVEPITLPKK